MTKLNLLKAIFIFITVCCAFNGWSQSIYEKYGIYRNPIRVALNKVTWSVSAGQSFNHFQHRLDGFYFYQDANRQLLLPKTDETAPIAGGAVTGIGNWLTRPVLFPDIDTLLRFDIPYEYLSNPVNNPALDANFLMIDGDTIDFGFQRVMIGIPINLAASYEFSNFRVGAGIGFERIAFKSMKPFGIEDQVRNYQPDIRATWLFQWHGMAGYRFIEYWNYQFVLEGRIGRISYGNGFDPAFLNRRIYGSLGVSIEQVWSEYFRLVLRPAYDFRDFTMVLPGGSGINHRHNSFSLQFGVSINIPEIPRTPYKSDHVQLKHIITDIETGQLREVRGQPFWKVQNPKVGQNHRKLIRYKLFNRRKIHPY